MTNRDPKAAREPRKKLAPRPKLAPRTTSKPAEKHLKVGNNIGSRLVLAVKPTSDHPGDSYLQQVLCWYGDQYVVWRYNAQDRGFFAGRYCGEDFEKASKIFLGQEDKEEE